MDSKFWKANEGNKDGQLLAKVTDLLEKGADVHAVDQYNSTALHYAVAQTAGTRTLLSPLSMTTAPEACLARWLYVNGITHGQPSNNVSVLPGGASVLLVRPPGWPKADCEAPGRRWLAKCL